MRPSKEEVFLRLAVELSRLSTCARRRVGCVLIDDRWDVVGLGYNGVAAGEAHCTEAPCPGAALPSGTGLDLCEALHAEQNALLRCRDPWRIAAALVTTAPCVTCVKLLLNTACRKIVFLEAYPHAPARALWERTGRLWQQIELEP